jgi:predicted solute-binding protein
MADDYPRRFARYGRFVLSAALVAGGAAVAVAAPASAVLVSVLTALLAGSVLMNAFKEELPSGREVEADLVLLIGEGARRRLAVVEVKVDANHAWYAAVENLPVAAVVLAPPDFYAHRGQKANAAGPARELFDRVRQELGIEAHLATFDAAVAPIFGR